MASLTLQQVLNRFRDRYEQQHPISTRQAQVCRHIQQCRTIDLGGEFLACRQCPYQRIQYHSCRDRHCPQCQYRATEAWADKQCQQVLPTKYFHVVFTLPHELNPLAQLHPDVVYRLLFQSVWKTLRHFGQSAHLGGQLGLLAILHTWGQNLSFHIHLHCLIPAGAWDASQQRWLPCKANGNYLFPVKALSTYYRGAMVRALRRARKRGEFTRLTDEPDFSAVLNTLMSKPWCVYSKRYLKRAESVISYLARYTFKTAISNKRLIEMDDEHVRFSWRDYRDGQRKIMPLKGDAFIQRFLQHTLPKGFMRIRRYGFLANALSAKQVAAIRQVLASESTQASNSEAEENNSPKPKSVNQRFCPHCQQDSLYTIDWIIPQFLRRLKRRR